MMASTSSKSEDSIEKMLFQYVRKGEWKKVVEKYKATAEAHKAKITRAGHTALHLAVSHLKEDVVQKLVEQIKNKAEKPKEILEIKDKRGYTALHFAAALGSTKICECLASVDSSLVGVTNDEGETPLFWSVLYGQKETFQFLHESICGSKDSQASEEAYTYSRRTDQGETILHCAIYGEDFDLALSIIEKYKDLVDRVDNNGISPLDTLANKPSCFKSGSKLRGWDKIIYSLIDVSTTADTCGVQRRKTADPEDPQRHDPHTGTLGSQEHCSPEIKFAIFFKFLINIAYKAIVVIFEYGGLKWTNTRIRREKEKHVKVIQVLNKLVQELHMYDSADKQSGGNPKMKHEHDNFFPQHDPETSHHESEGSKEKEGKDKKTTKKYKTETAMIVAAKNGISEIVDKILKDYPMAIHDTEQNTRKNILLLAAEKRHLEVFKLLKNSKENLPQQLVFQKVDDKRNSALHLAAMLDENNPIPWPIPGAALQMQWELKWFKFVEQSMPPHFFLRANKDGQTPQDIFTESHKNLVKAGGKWLTSTSTSCSVVAALIATVTFTSSTTYPGGTNSQNGKPTLENQPSLEMFSISSLIALCFSVTSLIIFLAILTSRHQEKDFTNDLPRKLLVGLTTLFISIASMITSFCAGHFIVLEPKLKNLAFPVYATMFLPVCLFALAQLPLYLDLIKAIFWSPF